MRLVSQAPRSWDGPAPIGGLVFQIGETSARRFSQAEVNSQPGVDTFKLTTAFLPPVEERHGSQKEQAEQRAEG